MSIFQRYPRDVTRGERIAFWLIAPVLFLIPPAAGVLIGIGEATIGLVLLGVWLASSMGLNIWTAARHARKRKRHHG